MHIKLFNKWKFNYCNIFIILINYIKNNFNYLINKYN